MRALLASVAALLLAPVAAAQAGPATQPLAPPDWTAYGAREDLAAAGELAGARRVLRFVQVSDAHILDDDAPYPLRQENLDALGPPFTAAQRPQEEFTDEVLDATLRAVNALHARDPLQFVLNTGDNVDNDLENELMRFLDLYEGTSTLRGPVSGYPCRPDGQSASTGDASTDVTDACTSLPPALAAAAGRGLAPGLPWYSAFGNHDALIQGNANVEPSFQDVAQQVGRRFLYQHEYVAMHFPGADACPGGAPGGSAGDDHGHGYAFAGGRLCDGDPDNDGYYSFSVGAVRFAVLDTVNDDFVTGNANLQGAFNPQTMLGADVIGGYAEGSVDPAQAAWLAEEVAAHPDQLVVVVSHHTVNSMFSGLAEGYCSPAGCLHELLQESGYRTGPQLVEELSAHPNVVAWIGGHTHRNRVEAKLAGGGGFWNVESSSLIDFPQEARVVELWVSAGGAKAFWRLTGLTHGFQPSRDLERTDPQREPAAQGGPGDRDVLLWFDVPPGVRLQPLPEAPRQWRVRLAEPDRHGTAGQPFEATLLVDDLLHPDGPLPAGTNLGASAFFRPADGSVPVLSPGASFVGVGLQSADRGTHLEASLAFTPEEAGTYYAIVEVAPPNQAYAYQLVSVSVDPAPGGGKDSPGAAFVLLGLAILGAALARR